MEFLEICFVDRVRGKNICIVYENIKLFVFRCGFSNDVFLFRFNCNIVFFELCIEFFCNGGIVVFIDVCDDYIGVFFNEMLCYFFFEVRCFFGYNCSFVFKFGYCIFFNVLLFYYGWYVY